MSELHLENNSIVKTLLTSNTPINLTAKLLSSSSNIIPKSSTSVLPSVHNKMIDDSIVITNMHNYYNVQHINVFKSDKELIAQEHCYSRPLHWTPESAFFQPTKRLFVSHPSTKRKSTNPLTPLQECEDFIDVETVGIQPSELYDKAKALHMMDECERHATFARVNQGNEDWEETISRINWTPTQNRLFNGVVNILNSHYLARLAHSKAHHEPVLRRIVIDKSVKRIRHLFATISWDSKLTQWLHQLLIDNLSTSYLAVYLDILQTLKSKLPTFVDKMMYGPNSMNRVGVTSNESLFHLLKRPWDPFALNSLQSKPRKLPGNPIIIIVPSATSVSNTSHFKRQQKWSNLLTNLATVVVVHANIGTAANCLTMINCADQILAATRTKIQEVKTDYPGKPIILLGFNAGAALALQVAQVEHVLCVICLGFSVLTAEGKRGEPDDSLLELQCPVLFVIGQCSNTSLQEDVEDLRERMRVENGLIVVGSADDYLRVNKKKKRTEGITQNAVDRFIVENVGEFVGNLLLSPYPPQMRQSPTHIVSTEAPAIKRGKAERRRNNSNCSSIESEPPSPTPKIPRPVGRPPGSKSKSKLESKWNAHLNQGIPQSSPDNSSPLIVTSSNETKPTLLHPPPLPQENTFIDKTLSKQHNFDITHFSDSQSNSIPKSNNSPIKTSSSAAKIMGFNRSVLTSGCTLSSLLQSGSRSTPLSHGIKTSSNIKVLENLSLNTNANAKLISNTTGRSVDLSKITILNSGGSTKTNAPVVLMPDGKIKAVGSTVKGTGSTPILLSMSSKSKNSHASQSNSAAHRVAKYITSKKQLIGKKPPQKPSIVSSYSSSLPPPTNLTSQDIMDLPIIFADDNQMLLDNAKLQQSDISVPEIVQQPQTSTKASASNPVGKFVFINKQIPLQTSVNLTSTSPASALKRPALSVPVRSNANPVKYTKIIISRGTTAETKTTTTGALTKISSFSPEISIRKIEPSPSAVSLDGGDLENKLVATAIPKPEYVISSIKHLSKNEAETETMLGESQSPIKVDTKKRTAEDANLNNDKNEIDDSLPMKCSKLIH